MNNKIKQLSRKAAAMITAASALLAVGAPLMTVLADNNNIVISNEDEFYEFAKMCKTDAWSRGKTVWLTNDLNLSGKETVYAATFGGTFVGNGHTISGVNIYEKGSYLGLFRYVQASGTIDGLTVTGELKPDGSKKNIGGIAGENSGKITNCSFIGSIEGDSNVGGICGSMTESAVVSDCKFEGSVTGKSYVGGIAGQSHGLVEKCENRGSINTTDTEESKTIQDVDIDLAKLGTTESISAATDTGGICGFSKGKIIECANYGNVGYESIGYNTGGICGRQSGLIRGCENSGEIRGRKDVGGISGQAEPYIMLEYTEDILQQMHDVLDKIKDIMDNGTLRHSNEISDSLTKLNDQVKAVKDKTEPISDDMQSYADEISDNMNRLSDKLHKAIDDASAVFDSLGTAGDKITAGADKISESRDDVDAIFDNIENSINAAKDLKDNLPEKEKDKALDELDDALDYLELASKRMSSAFDELDAGTDELSDGIKKIQKSIKALSAALEKKENVENSFKDVWSNLGEIQDAVDKTEGALEKLITIIEELYDKGYIKDDVIASIRAAKELARCYEEMGTALIGIKDGLLMLATDFDSYSIPSAFRYMSMGMLNLSQAMNRLGRAGDSARDAMDILKKQTDKTGDIISDEMDAADAAGERVKDRLRDGFDQISDGADEIGNAMDSLSVIADEFAAGEEIKLPKASDVFGDDFDSLFDSLDLLNDEITNTKDVLSGKKDELSDELDNLSDELESLSRIMSDAYNDNVKEEKSDKIEDLAVEDNSTAGTTGKIEESVNKGEIYGDVNVGGIVGSMAIEYDFDPEDDIKKDGNKSLDFIYKTKTLVMRSRNEGKIEAKKNYAGGIAGRMDMGSVLSCQNYGDIKSNDGDYVGGIAGLADATVRNSLAKCKVEGGDYVGGIAGKAHKLTNCRALVNVAEYGECGGAIAGYAEDRKELSANAFVGDAIGALDDINYQGVAEQTDVDEFASFAKKNYDENVVFTLTFKADGVEVGRVDFEYRLPIAPELIPKVPDKDGYYGKWSEYDFDEPRYDAVIEAEYYRDINLIEADITREADKPVLLLCGAFDDKAGMDVYENKEYTEKLDKDKIEDSYTAKIHDTYTESYIMRYLPKNEESKIDLYVEYGDTVDRAKLKSFGSYLEFEVPSSEFKIYEVRKGIPWAAILSSGGGVLVIAALAVLLIIRKKKGKPILPKRKKDVSAK